MPTEYINTIIGVAIVSGIIFIITLAILHDIIKSLRKDIKELRERYVDSHYRFCSMFERLADRITKIEEKTK